MSNSQRNLIGEIVKQLRDYIFYDRFGCIYESMSGIQILIEFKLK